MPIYIVICISIGYNIAFNFYYTYINCIRSYIATYYSCYHKVRSIANMYGKCIILVCYLTIATYVARLFDKQTIKNEMHPKNPNYVIK